MPTVREIATVRPQQALSAKDSADPIVERSWMIWTAMKEAAERSGSERDAAGNLLFATNLKAHARFLYPDDVNWDDKDAVAAFMDPVYMYLRRHGIAKVVHRNVGGDFTVSVWAVSPRFDGGTARRLDLNEGLSKREARLTAAEAGEDREPAPVTIRTITKEDGVDSYPCTEPGCDRTFSSPQARNGHKPSHIPGNVGRERSPRSFVVDKESLVAGREEAAALGVPTKAVKTDDPAAPWKCAVCDEKFTTKFAIGGHMKAHVRAAMREKIAALEAENKALRSRRAAKVEQAEAVARVSNGLPAANGTKDVTAALAVLSEVLGVATDPTEVTRLRAEIEVLRRERDEAVQKVDTLRSIFSPLSA
jgi:cell division protein FtsB